jgi:glycosyltransferase involved in cell wall biosynthesis
MPIGSGFAPDLSICIPTYNRAGLLAQCLSHLSTFSSFKFDVVVGDNASNDDTRRVVSEHASKFAQLSYVRHDTNIGVGRNVHSIVCQARGRYAYVVADDDIVFENGLSLLKTALDSRPDLLAASGDYSPSLVAPDIGKNVTYGVVRHFHIARGNFLALADNFLLCDGYPMVRTDAYRRHCSSPDRGFGIISMFSQLLKYGDLMFYDQPIFSHFQNRESLSFGLPEPWYYDSCSADIEIAFGCIPEPPLTRHPPTSPVALQSNYLLSIGAHVSD